MAGSKAQEIGGQLQAPQSTSQPASPAPKVEEAVVGILPANYKKVPHSQGGKHIHPTHSQPMHSTVDPSSANNVGMQTHSNTQVMPHAHTHPPPPETQAPIHPQHQPVGAVAYTYPSQPPTNAEQGRPYDQGQVQYYQAGQNVQMMRPQVPQQPTQYSHYPWPQQHPGQPVRAQQVQQGYYFAPNQPVPTGRGPRGPPPQFEQQVTTYPYDIQAQQHHGQFVQDHQMHQDISGQNYGPVAGMHGPQGTLPQAPGPQQPPMRAYQHMQTTQSPELHSQMPHTPMQKVPIEAHHAALPHTSAPAVYQRPVQAMEQDTSQAQAPIHLAQNPVGEVKPSQQPAISDTNRPAPPPPQKPPVSREYSNTAGDGELLMENLDEDISDTAAKVNVTGRIVEAPPVDPNLHCVMCDRYFGIGEIQLYRRHVATCSGSGQ